MYSTFHILTLLLITSACYCVMCQDVENIFEFLAFGLRYITFQGRANDVQHLPHLIIICVLEILLFLCKRD